MEKWVDAICRVCGLRATEDAPPTATTRHNVLGMLFIMSLLRSIKYNRIQYNRYIIQII